MKRIKLGITGQFKLTAYLSYGFSALMIILLVISLTRLGGNVEAQVQRQEIIRGLQEQIVAMVVLAIVGTIIGFAMRARIQRAVAEVSRVLDASAEGDLTQRAEIFSSDEIGSLSQAVNDSIESLQQLVTRLRNDAGHLEEFSVNANRESTSIQDNNEKVFQSTQELSAIGENLNSMAESLTDNGAAVAGDIAKLSGAATGNAQLREEGLTAAGDLDSAVIELKTAVDKIHCLMQDINIISGETNMLALNATIEAARSGEAGKGFKVVADQAKDLASQTAETTDEVLGRVLALQAQAGEGATEISRLHQQMEALTAGQDSSSQALASQEESLGCCTKGVASVRDMAAEIAVQASDLFELVQTSHEESLHFQEHMKVLAEDVAVLNNRVAQFTV